MQPQVEVSKPAQKSSLVSWLLVDMMLRQKSLILMTIHGYLDLLLKQLVKSGLLLQSHTRTHSLLLADMMDMMERVTWTPSSTLMQQPWSGLHLPEGSKQEEALQQASWFLNLL
jgi:hypothetical protein